MKVLDGASRSGPGGVPSSTRHLSVVQNDDQPPVNLDDWRVPIASPVREVICAHVNLRYGVPESDRDAFDKLLTVYDDARDALVDHLREGGAA